MLIIIARVRSDKRVRASFTHDEAYRLFNTNTKQVADIPRKEMLDALKKGIKVKGLKVSGEYNNTVWEKGKYSLNKVPLIDGYGNLINVSDKDTRIVYGYKGFAEAKKFCIVDYLGNIEEVPLDDFINLTKEHKVNGAQLIDGKVAVSRDLYNEVR